MSKSEQFDLRLNRRQMMLMSSAACACSSLGRVAMAQADSGIASCVEVESWYGDALNGRAVDRQASLRASVNALSNRIPAAQRNPAGIPGAALAPSFDQPFFSMPTSPGITNVNPTRVQSTIVDVQRGLQTDNIRVQEGVMKWTALWDRGSRVTFRFMVQGTYPAGEQAIRDAVEVWRPLCGLNLVEVTSGQANIRITFAPGQGHYSMIGTESSGSPRRTQFNESLNIDPNGVGGSATFLNGVALHEFGHAIGFMHEHQNPSDNIQWDVAAVNGYFSRPPNNWNAQTIRDNIFAVLNDPANYVFTNNRDPLSIMHYWFPRSLYRSSGVTVPDAPINRLSDTDRRFCAERYGQPVPPPTGGTGTEPPKPVVVITDRQKLKSANAKALTVDTAVVGEFPSDPQLHLYKVEVSTGDDYVLETVDGPLLQTDGSLLGGILSGAMPVVLELFDGTDFSEEKAIKVSMFGDIGSLGVQDAYLKYKLEKGKTYYLVSRPQQRLKSGAKGAYKLLLRQAGSGRVGLTGKSWGGIKKEITDLQADIKGVQAKTKSLLDQLRK